MQTQKDLQAHFTIAFEHHQEGKLPEAIVGYQRLVILIPNAAAVWALLGTAINQDSRHAEGVIFLIRAKNLDPLNPSTYSNLGNAFKESDQLTESVSCLRCALTIAPAFADAHKNLGSVHITLSDYEAGLMHLDRASKVNPRSPEAHLAKGVAAGKRGHTNVALKAYGAAAILDPLYAEAYVQTGETLISQGDISRAIITFDRAIHLDKGLSEAYLGLGRALLERQKYQEALLNFELTTKLKGDALYAHLGKTQALSSMERHEEAIGQAKHSIALWPDHTETYLSLGDALYEQGDDRYALTMFDRSTLIDDRLADAYLNKSIIKLKNGEFESGWTLCYRRFETKNLDNERLSLQHKMCKPGFKGDRLWIWCEHGIGDQILFGGILEDIKKDFSQITVTFDKRIVPIFSRSFPEISFTDQTDIPSSSYDGHLPMGNLPMVFRKFMGEPRPQAYLRSDPQQTKELRSLLNKNGKILCGLSWESQKIGLGREKSLYLLDLLPLLRLPNFEFISLQYGNVASQLANLQDETGIIIRQYEPIDNFSNLDGLASLIDACDLVISSCNTTAHIAGALGKETHLLAPLRGKAQQWYWAPSGSSKSQWYPSIEVYHQAEGRDWQKPLQAVYDRIWAQWI